ncbi:putative sodium channel alpha-toxin Acra5 isoform X2 [Centruroides sculpturatus]|uniref:putative sodium channel alpha-toxin Acra5 isoform X1 n=1 Tax=Centruroides sculpturatus TaxID=218467 RepID=UPI000C6E92A8|nr:putative sodium channel alpha-toxin Acra5 isoform X1 [Centruroides sculpturatus]XP_023216725.1 putative sodium channel alpha-toxin Acra5 isoform X2 [Centruroides sculpturatus]
MKLLLLLLIALLIEVDGLKNGYVLHKNSNCKYSCNITDKWGYCSPLCQKKHGKTGYCYFFACWCEGLPSDTPVYGDEGYTCW